MCICFLLIQVWLSYIVTFAAWLIEQDTLWNCLTVHLYNWSVGCFHLRHPVSTSFTIYCVTIATLFISLCKCTKVPSPFLGSAQYEAMNKLPCFVFCFFYCWKVSAFLSWVSQLWIGFGTHVEFLIMRDRKCPPHI